MLQMSESQARQLGLTVKRDTDKGCEIAAPKPRPVYKPATSKQEMQLMACRVTGWKD